VSAGKLNVDIYTSFPLADAALARTYSMPGHAEGKIILLVDAAPSERRQKERANTSKLRYRPFAKSPNARFS
jgi:hypothetical protein